MNFSDIQGQLTQQLFMGSGRILNSFENLLLSLLLHRKIDPVKNEPHSEKTGFCLCENKGAVTAKLISAFVFATCIVRFLFFLNLKFQALSLFL